jgi:hypothetical protein
MLDVLGRSARRLLFWIQRDRLERGLAEEPELHIQLKQADATEEDRLREMGNLILAKEESRDQWGLVWMEHWLQDIRYPLRTFRKNSGVALSQPLLPTSTRSYSQLLLDDQSHTPGGGSGRTAVTGCRTAANAWALCAVSQRPAATQRTSLAEPLLLVRARPVTSLGSAALCRNESGSHKSGFSTGELPVVERGRPPWLYLTERLLGLEFL